MLRRGIRWCVHAPSTTSARERAASKAVLKNPAAAFAFAQIAKPGPRRREMAASLVSTSRSIGQLRGALVRIAQAARQIVACYERFGPERALGIRRPERLEVQRALLRGVAQLPWRRGAVARPRAARPVPNRQHPRERSKPCPTSGVSRKYAGIAVGWRRRSPTPPLPVTDEQRSVLGEVDPIAHRAAPRCATTRVLLMASDGFANTRIASEVGVAPMTVKAWRDRFAEDGLKDFSAVRPGRGRRPSIPAAKVEEIVRLTLHETPPGETHWSCRTMAKRAGVSSRPCSGSGPRGGSSRTA